MKSKQGWQEPFLALDGGKEGLDLYEALLPQAFTCLKAQGSLYLEIGDGQSLRVKELGEKTGFARIEIRHDLAGIPRILKMVTPS